LLRSFFSAAHKNTGAPFGFPGSPHSRSFIVRQDNKFFTVLLFAIHFVIGASLGRFATQRREMKLAAGTRLVFFLVLAAFSFFYILS
jgi:hypothetical protein